MYHILYKIPKQGMSKWETVYKSHDPHCIPYSVLEGYAATMISYSNYSNMYQG